MNKFIIVYKYKYIITISLVIRLLLTELLKRRHRKVSNLDAVLLISFQFHLIVYSFHY